MPKGKLERLLENWTVDYTWNTYGVEGIKMKFAERSGEPDRLFLFHGGRPLWFEFKREGEPLRPLQAHRQQELKAWGYDVETSDNKADSKAIIDAAAQRAGIRPLTKAVGPKKVSAPRGPFRAFKRMRGNMG